MDLVNMVIIMRQHHSTGLIKCQRGGLRDFVSHYADMMTTVREAIYADMRHAIYADMRQR